MEGRQASSPICDCNGEQTGTEPAIQPAKALSFDDVKYHLCKSLTGVSRWVSVAYHKHLIVPGLGTNCRTS